MRLPWFLRRGRRDAQVIRVDLSEMEATTARRSMEAKWPKVHELTAEHREVRAQNHFAQSVHKALGGRP